MSKHVRNNTLFESLGMSNYEYALQGNPTGDNVKIVQEAPKYEYYITPKETRDEI
jgi:hypothetical protein